jgi:hypothetical protein
MTMIRATHLAGALLVLPLIAASAQERPIGWSYTTNSTTDSGDASHRASMAVRHQVLDHKVRMEFVQVSNMRDADGAEGIFQIINAADSTMTMVMPTNHMATVMNVGGMMAGREVVPKIVPHVTKSQVEDLGAGEKILGHLTRHVRVTTEGTVDVTLGARRCTGSTNSVSEMWIAPDIDMLAASDATMSVLRDAMGMEEASRPEARASGIPAGTTLRSISKSTRVNAKGKPITVTTTTEFVELSHGPLDPSLFAVPSDYQVMDMRKMMAQMPAGMLDSALESGTQQSGSAMLKALCNESGGKP